jgi:hypothetical protein
MTNFTGSIAGRLDRLPAPGHLVHVVVDWTINSQMNQMSR